MKVNFFKWQVPHNRQEYRRTIFTQNGKRNQKHNNKVALTKSRKIATLTGKGSIKHHQIGMRYRGRIFFPAPEKYLHLVSKFHNIKQIELHI